MLEESHSVNTLKESSYNGAVSKERCSQVQHTNSTISLTWQPGHHSYVTSLYIPLLTANCLATSNLKGRESTALPYARKEERRKDG